MRIYYNTDINYIITQQVGVYRENVHIDKKKKKIALQTYHVKYILY